MNKDIDDYIKALEEIGYTYEEAKNFVEKATRPVDISYMDEEMQKLIDEYNNIGCTSFQLSSDELKKILEEQYNAEIYKRICL